MEVRPVMDYSEFGFETADAKAELARPVSEPGRTRPAQANPRSIRLPS